MNNSRLSFAPLTRKIPECVSHSVCARHVTENSAGFVFVKAFVAIDRTVFRRMERNFRLLAAISANGFKHFFRLVAVHPGFTCGTAMRAAFRLIGEAFFRHRIPVPIRKKQILRRTPRISGSCLQTSYSHSFSLYPIGTT